jgi:hypothetical protein
MQGGTANYPQGSSHLVEQGQNAQARPVIMRAAAAFQNVLQRQRILAGQGKAAPIQKLNAASVDDHKAV